MSVTISLLDLANLSISHPEPGMVNFMALQSLLHAIIRHLGIQDVQTQERPELFQIADKLRPLPVPEAEPPGTVRGPYRQLEQQLRDVERQVQELSRLPTASELLERSRLDGNSVHDMWSMLQMKKSTEANRDGVDKVNNTPSETLNSIAARLHHCN